VELRNKGSVPHSFTVDDQEIDVVLAPGATKTVTVEASTGPSTNFYCKFHVSSGMQGALFVKAGASGTKATSDSKTTTKTTTRTTSKSGPGGYDYGP
jgi:hypothetical protein